MVKGALLFFGGIENGTSREDIRNKLQDYGPIAWIDFNKGDPDCVIRYDQENKAKDVFEKVMADTNNEVKFNGVKAEGRVLEGDEEVTRWKKMIEDSINRRNKKMNSKNFKKGKWGKRPSKSTREAMKYVAKVEAEAKSAAIGEPAAKKAKVDG